MRGCDDQATIQSRTETVQERDETSKKRATCDEPCEQSDTTIQSDKKSNCTNRNRSTTLIDAVMTRCALVDVSRRDGTVMSSKHRDLTSHSRLMS